MNNRHRDAHSLLSALGHSSRFRIALCLLEGERCVGELAKAIGLSQSCTTRHVQVLERAGVVRSRRDGKRVVVGIEAETGAVAGLLEWIAPEAPAALVRSGAARAAAPGTSRGRPRAAAPVAPGGKASRAEKRTAPRPAAGAPRRSGGPPAEAGIAAAAPSRGDAPGSEPAEAPPASQPTSGTHAMPEPASPSMPRRPRETLEDFLL